MMKKFVAMLLSLVLLLSCGAGFRCAAEQPLDTDQVWELVGKAYIYAFPLALTDATKTLSVPASPPFPAFRQAGAAPSAPLQFAAQTVPARQKSYSY